MNIWKTVTKRILLIAFDIFNKIALNFNSLNAEFKQEYP
jgi:hypothetical protein